MSLSKLNLVATLAAFAAQLAEGGTAIAPADIGRRVESRGEYHRGPRGNLIRTDLRGQLRRERRRGEISARQQRKAIKASRRGNVA